MDRQVRKTRESLYAAFVALVTERGFERVRVSDIVGAADVGRTTFYAHFKTKKDLLRYGFERMRTELAPLSSTGEEPWAFLAPLLRHARSHTGLFRALVAGGGGEDAEIEFQRIIAGLVAGATGRRASEARARSIIVGALMAGVRHWIENGTKPSEEASLVRDIRAVADTLIHRN
jgi:AcrR family transcriptional regulator